MDPRPKPSRWPTVVVVLALVALGGTLAAAAWLVLRGGGPLVGDRAAPDLLRAGLSAPLTTLDPAAATNASDHTLQAMLFEGLVAPATGAQAPEPRLAAMLPQPSADGLTWTITCRRDVTFHDGQPFTCADAQATLERLRSEAPTLAASDIDAATLVALLERIQAMQVTESHTLVVRLREPFAFFNEALAHPAAAITRGEAGTGPFRLDRWNTDGASLEAYEAYWGGPPELARVSLVVMPDAAARLDALGQTVDAIDGPPPQAEFDGRSRVLVGAEGARVIVAAFNRAASPLDNPALRQALATGLDAEAVSEAVFANHARPAAPFDGSDTPAFQTDLRRAREMQANVGFPDGYTLDLYVDSAIPEWEVLAGALRGQLDALYLDGSAGILPVPLQASFASDEPLAFVVFARTPPDPYAVLSWLAEQPPPEGNNFVAYDSADFRAQMALAAAAPSPEARDAALTNASAVLQADSPVLFLISPDVLAATTTEVSGLSVSPLGWMVISRQTLVLRP